MASARMMTDKATLHISLIHQRHKLTSYKNALISHIINYTNGCITRLFVKLQCWGFDRNQLMLSLFNWPAVVKIMLRLKLLVWYSTDKVCTGSLTCCQIFQSKRTTHTCSTVHRVYYSVQCIIRIQFCCIKSMLSNTTALLQLAGNMKSIYLGDFTSPVLFISPLISHSLHER